MDLKVWNDRNNRRNEIKRIARNKLKSGRKASNYSNKTPASGYLLEKILRPFAKGF